MALPGISSYGAAPNTNAAGGTNSANTPTRSSTASADLGMTDFLQLLAAQFTNQDIMNPTDNTDYITELAQFASIQAMNTLTAYADAQYASTLVGKTVEVERADATGKTVIDTGVVNYVDFTSGSSTLMVNGQAYDLSSVRRVVNGTGDSVTDPGDSGDDPGDSDTDPGEVGDGA